ncbi:MAG: hypothetical protein WCB63_16820, partial [Polyangiales bacterium]
VKRVAEVREDVDCTKNSSQTGKEWNSRASRTIASDRLSLMEKGLALGSPNHPIGGSVKAES